MQLRNVRCARVTPTKTHARLPARTELNTATGECVCKTGFFRQGGAKSEGACITCGPRGRPDSAARPTRCICNDGYGQSKDGGCRRCDRGERTVAGVCKRARR